MIAQSFERIHRSNLIGMGVLPLQFYKGDSAAEPGADGHERFSIAGLEVLNEGELPKELTVTATADDGSVTEFRVVVRIDTPMEAEYYRHGGILQYVLRQMAGSSPTALSGLGAEVSSVASRDNGRCRDHGPKASPTALVDVQWPSATSRRCGATCTRSVIS